MCLLDRRSNIVIAQQASLIYRQSVTQPFILASQPAIYLAIKPTSRQTSQPENVLGIQRAAANYTYSTKYSYFTKTERIHIDQPTWVFSGWNQHQGNHRPNASHYIPLLTKYIPSLCNI